MAWRITAATRRDSPTSTRSSIEPWLLWQTKLMNANDVNNLLLALTGVLVVLTGAVTWFAWKTVQESQKATKAIKQTVAESNKAAEAARETVAALTELL